MRLKRGTSGQILMTILWGRLWIHSTPAGPGVGCCKGKGRGWSEVIARSNQCYNSKLEAWHFINMLLLNPHSFIYSLNTYWMPTTYHILLSTQEWMRLAMPLSSWSLHSTWGSFNKWINKLLSRLTTIKNTKCSKAGEFTEHDGGTSQGRRHWESDVWAKTGMEWGRVM